MSIAVGSGWTIGIYDIIGISIIESIIKTMPAIITPFHFPVIIQANNIIIVNINNIPVMNELAKFSIIYYSLYITSSFLFFFFNTSSLRFTSSTL